jgi:hypothetical protein
MSFLRFEYYINKTRREIEGNPCAFLTSTLYGEE